MPVNFLTTQPVSLIQFKDESLLVPMGSTLREFDEVTGNFWKGYTEEKIKNPNASFEIDEVFETAFQWLNAPYLWGGKTLMGVDCSGFVQTVFKLYGIKLKRDAYQQAEQGELTDISHSQAGDLAFFQNEKQKITHVGIVLEGPTIIHASGKVRIDQLDKKEF